MRNLLFISGYRIDQIETNGVAKKINLEINTFKKQGFTVDNIEFDAGEVYLNSKGVRTFLLKESSSFYSTMDRLYKILSKDKNLDLQYDMIYVRYEHFSFSMIKFFKELKIRLPQIKIVGELPTYMAKPTQGSSLKTIISFKIKRLLNNLTNKHIDYLATFSSHDSLFRIPTIKIENFVDVDNIKVREPIVDEVVDLLALAQITFAHGFDRIIEGLNNYYSQPIVKKSVVLHIVGDGSIRQDLVNLVEKYNLTKYVKFYGSLGGEKLNDIFNKSDIGIGSLAIFRKGSTKASELKVREYTARGLPFIYSAEEPQVKGQNFALQVPFDESAIDIDKILEFYMDVYKDDNLLDTMRLFAEKEFTCESQIGKIVNTVFA